MSNIQWVPCELQNPHQPPKFVIAGIDSDGSVMVVGRAAQHCGASAAVKVNLTTKKAHVVYDDGRELLKDSFEFLMGDGFQWEDSKNGIIPQYAVSSGKASANGETTYIGRVYQNDSFKKDSLIIFDVQPSCICEISATPFEVLIQKPQAHWVSVWGDYQCLVDSPVEAGTDLDGAKVLVGRVHYKRNLIPAKVLPDKRWVSIPFGDEMIIDQLGDHECEILCGSGFSWVPSHSGVAHVNAFVGGHTSDGELLYIGRGLVDNKGSMMMIPGKIHPSHGCLYIPHNGEEIQRKNYEILVQEEM